MGGTRVFEECLNLCYSYKIVMTETDKSRNNSISILFRIMHSRPRRTTKRVEKGCLWGV